MCKCPHVKASSPLIQPIRYTNPTTVATSKKQQKSEYCTLKKAYSAKESA